LKVFYLRFVVIQCVLAAGLVALWLSGYLIKPFEGDSRWFSAVVAALGGVGIILVGMRQFAHAAWLADKMVRIAVIGMQVGILAALASVSKSILSGGDVTQVAALFLGSIGIAFYVSLIALSCNLWLELSLRLLGWYDEQEE
jgi:hypothetical protein